MFEVLYPEDGGQTESEFDAYLRGIPNERRVAVIDALLGLAVQPRPVGSSGVRYWETPEPDILKSFLRFPPGKPFRGPSQAYHELLAASHHIAVAGVVVVYAVKGERYVYLMALRDE